MEDGEEGVESGLLGVKGWGERNKEMCGECVGGVMVRGVFDGGWEGM